MDTIVEPDLAPPGAGLPAPELLIARLLFAWRRIRSTRESSKAAFQHERALIRSLVDGCNPQDATRRVLIPRPRGLEDSSRHWSIWMVLDHLRIMNHGMAGIIRSLAAGTVPPRKASTAAVKPSPDVDATVRNAYEQSCDAFLATDDIPDLKTPVRFEHPWFGPLDAAAWHVMAGFHMALHRAQIESILSQMNLAEAHSLR